MDPGQHMTIGSLDKSIEKIQKASSKLKLHKVSKQKKERLKYAKNVSKEAKKVNHTKLDILTDFLLSEGLKL